MSALKTLNAGKKPKSNVQFAATVAYFYRFEVPQADRKTEINSEDLYLSGMAIEVQFATGYLWAFDQSRAQ